MRLVPAWYTRWRKRRQREKEERRRAAMLTRNAASAVPVEDITPDGRLIGVDGATRVVLAPKMEPFGSMSEPELEGALSRLAEAFNGIPFPHKVKFVATSRSGGWESQVEARRATLNRITGPERRLALASLEQLTRAIDRGSVRTRESYIVAESDDPVELSRLTDYLRRAFSARIVRGQEAMAAEVIAWRGKPLPDTGIWIVGGDKAGQPEMVVVGGKASVRKRPPDPAIPVAVHSNPPGKLRGNTTALTRS